MAESRSEGDFINFYRQIEELDPNRDRAENYAALRKAYAYWRKVNRPEAQIKQYLIREAERFFATDEAFAKYKMKLLDRELKPLMDEALSDDGSITLDELQKIIAKTQKAGIHERDVQEYLDSQEIVVRKKSKTEEEVINKAGDQTSALATAEQICSQSEKVALIASVPAVFMSHIFFVKILGFPSELLFLLSAAGLVLLSYRSTFAPVIQDTIRRAFNKEESMIARAAGFAIGFIAVGTMTAWAASFTIVLFPTSIILSKELYLEKKLNAYFQKEGVSNASKTVAWGIALAPCLTLTIIMLMMLALVPNR
jgi:hypothetical protein